MKKNCSSSLEIMEMQVRTILRSHRTLVEMEKINKTVSNTCWMMCEEKRDPHSPLVGLQRGKSVWKIFQKRKVNLLCDMCPWQMPNRLNILLYRDLLSHVYFCSIHNS